MHFQQKNFLAVTFIFTISRVGLRIPVSFNAKHELGLDLLFYASELDWP